MDLDHDEHHAKRRKTKTRHEQQQQPTALETLPNEIIVHILSRLPITSFVQFKFVCKRWRALAQDPVLAADMHLSSKADGNDPCLILHCDFPIRNQLYFLDLSADNQDKDKVKRLYVPFQATMPEFDVVGSCNGLLCLSDSLYNDALYVHNPFTMDYIELPESRRYPDQELVFGFGFHPETKEYKVVKIVYYRNISNYSYRRARRTVYPQSDVQIFTLGTSSWRSLGKVSYQFVRRPSEALVNGRLHWVSRPRRYHPARRIISFDLADEQFREVPKPDCGGLTRCNFHLSVLQGCLAVAVYGNYGKLEIWVMKCYNEKESWVKEFTIGAYMHKCLKPNLDRDRPLKIWKHNGKVVRVLCLLENGQVLLEYKNRVLVSYDPKKGKFRDLVFQGIPNWFQTVVHTGSLIWL
ncbi:hypothetical protein V6N13_127995 [Hibiscus sabdariffa]|uniref:F-box domain-containing protein n=1 Tax=Hibiscus sabdariffa TaxID=183260 RepID=A0ABR2CES6_9ROSI